MPLKARRMRHFNSSVSRMASDLKARIQKRLPSAKAFINIKLEVFIPFSYLSREEDMPRKILSFNIVEKVCTSPIFGKVLIAVLKCNLSETI